MTGPGKTGFWEFALRLYEREGVKPALLYLQDVNGLDIPLFLFALWCGRYRRLKAAEMTDYLALATDYARHLVQPVREARRWLGSQQEETLYRHLLETELACEKAIMTRLEKRFFAKPGPPSTAGGHGVDNAELYLRTAGIPVDVKARKSLAIIYRQYRHLTTDN